MATITAKKFDGGVRFSGHFGDGHRTLTILDRYIAVFFGHFEQCLGLLARPGSSAEAIIRNLTRELNRRGTFTPVGEGLETVVRDVTPEAWNAFVEAVESKSLDSGDMTVGQLRDRLAEFDQTATVVLTWEGVSCPLKPSDVTVNPEDLYSVPRFTPWTYRLANVLWVDAERGVREISRPG